VKNPDNVISYRKVLAGLEKELAEFEAYLMELEDEDDCESETPLTLDELIELLDLVEQAYYDHLLHRIALLKQWLAVDEGRGE